MLTPRYDGAVTARDQQAAEEFSAYLVNFVKNGDPNGEGLPEWPVFEQDPKAERIWLVERAADRAAD